MAVTSTPQEPPPRISIRRMARGLVAGNKGDVVFKGTALLFTLFIVLIAGLMVFEIWDASRPSIAEFGFFTFPFSDAWDPVFRDFGAAHVAVGTLLTSFIAVVIAVPIAIGVALFVTELAPPWLRGPVAFLVDILAAIPSIVYGLWAFFVLVPLMRDLGNNFLIPTLGWTGLFSGPYWGLGTLTAGVVLAVMIIPIISAVAREVIAQVPRDQSEAMLALGATKWEVLWKIVLPYARAGIVGAVMLGLARAIGETMAVTMVIGNRVELTQNLLGLNATMASLIASEFREATYNLYISALIHVGLVLMMISLFVNIVARLLVWMGERKIGVRR
jgi:phosphate transport system permease protein